MTGLTPVFRLLTLSGLAASLINTAGLALPLPAAAQSANLDTTVVEAREAARKRDRSRLAAARAAMQAGQHPLTPWVEYWDLSNRLPDAQADEVEAFYARWSGSYVEDRLRNDWLLELGKRRDWPALARDYPRFRMNDDREVTCFWLFTEHLAGRDVREPARNTWFAQKDLDEGCNLLATAMVDAKRFTPDDVWRKARLALEGQRPAAAKAAAGLLGNPIAREAAEAIDNPARFLRRSTGNAAVGSHQQQELRLLAVMRLATTDTDAAAAALDGGTLGLSPALAGWGWAYTGRQAAFKLSPDAAALYQRGLAGLRGDETRHPGWSDDTLAWGVRASLRNSAPAQRWPQVQRLIDAMSPAEQRDPAWVYWKARALQAQARDGAEGEAQRAEARRLFDSIAGGLGFYPALAAEDLGRVPVLPAPPAPPSAAERDAARTSPGLARALLLADLGLRDEARREWNFTLRGLADRELLAAARLACERSDWQLCINTAERSRGEIDTGLRYPMPYAAEITQAANAAGLEPALVFGLIRQETRFMPQLRSGVGAAGLMQVMPATAKWVAKKIGMDWRNPEQISDPQVNLRLGTSYLKMVLDDLGGSQAMAAAAYNAGPGRPRRWRDGPTVETAVWAENIPFNETRDYVKKVLSNAAVYSALLDSQKPPVLRPRLGPGIGPRDAGAATSNTELP
jgi:soluble lytic murein transglycosylase